jgi:hypothetical protein
LNLRSNFLDNSVVSFLAKSPFVDCAKIPMLIKQKESNIMFFKILISQKLILLVC